MGHEHHHHHPRDHHHHHVGVMTPQQALWVSVVLSAGFMVLEAGMAWYTGSLALFADAGHMLSDVGALGLALFAQRFSMRAHDRRATFGYRRAEVLAAFLNGVALTVISLWIAVEAIGRWWSPVALRHEGLIETAVAGLVVNAGVAWILSRASSDNINVRAAMAHVLVDLLGSLNAIAAGVLVVFFGFNRADSVLSTIIALLVLVSGYRILKETTSVLLESAPHELDTTALARTIEQTPGVASFHDLHAWRISEGFDAVTVHVVLAPAHHGVEVSREVCQRIQREHGISHATVQPEAPPPSPIVTLGRRAAARERGDGGGSKPVPIATRRRTP
jgi:cobalt-zinc-cadmium efflux system protein